MTWTNVKDAMPPINTPVLVQNKIPKMKVLQDEYAVAYLDETSTWRVIDQGVQVIHGQHHERLELVYEPTHWLEFEPLL